MAEIHVAKPYTYVASLVFHAIFPIISKLSAKPSDEKRMKL
jgi:hypothetical protein